MPVEREIRESLEDLPKAYEWALGSGAVKTLAEMMKGSRKVYFVGCGSSHHLSLTASRYFTGISGKDSKAVPAGEVIFATEFSLSRGEGLAVLMSRSGETTETVLALKRMKEMGFKTIGVTVERESTLAKEADLPLILPVREESIVMTKSFGVTLLVLQIASEMSAGVFERGDYEEILSKLGDVFKESWKEAKNFADGDYYVFLGIGPYEGIAREAALKLEEMSLTKVEAMSTFEYRHGPKALVEEGFRIVIYGDGEEEKKLADELEGYGAKVLLRRRYSSGYRDSFVQTFLGQMLGLEIARRKGVDVESPRHLTKIVKI